MKCDIALLQCHQRWLLANELEELWCVEYDLIEKRYFHIFDSRGIDPGQDLLQIFADAFESNFSETGEDRACQRRRSLTPAS